MMFSTVETGSSAGEIQITMPADREVVDSYVISIRVCIACSVAVMSISPINEHLTTGFPRGQLL